MLKLLIFVSSVLVVLSAPPDPTYPLYKFNVADADKSFVPIANESYRLPTDTVPIQYIIDLKTSIHKGDFSFDGYVEILLKVLNKTSKIVLHQRQLTINKCELLKDNKPVEIEDLIYDKTYEFLTIPTSKPIDVGEYALKIHYNGTLRGKDGEDKLDAGFYRSSYKDDKGETKWLATTQFESTDARHAFPCYDEPGTKAVFSIKITHGNLYTAIANTPVTTVEVIDGEFSQTIFKDTPIMSTYLVAFVISDFKPKFDNKAKPKHGVYAIPHRISEVDVALKYGVKVLKTLEDYVDVKYPIGKMDQIGIPDFAAGAMENWGLVTYQVGALYYDKKTSPYKQEESILSIIAHEYAHQYFGDLVSPEWWNYIWLNEGFATLYSAYLSQIVEPKFQAMDSFVVNSLQSVLRADSLESTRAMTTDAFSPSEISKLFDNIAYDKSGCVLRMMMHVLNDTNFKKGIFNYMDAKKFQAANPNDLFENLHKAADKKNLPKDTTVTQIMTTWTTQKGYPLLNVIRDETNSNVIHLSQERYLLESSETTSKTTWYLPYNYVRGHNAEKPEDWTTDPNDWLTNVEKGDLEFKTGNELKDDEWILFNKHQTGYYRVNYDEKNWKLLINELNSAKYSEKIHYLNRAQLIDDAMMHARTDRLGYSIALGLLQYLSNERNYFPFVSFNAAMSHLETAVFGTNAHPALLNFTSQMTQNPHIYFGVAERPTTDKYHDYFARRLLLDWSCKSGNEICLINTAKALENHISENDTLPKVSDYLKDTIMTYGIRNATSQLHDAIWKKIIKGEDRSSLILALSNSQDEEFLKDLLEETISTKNELKLTLAEKKTILSKALDSGPIGFENVFNFLSEKSTKIIEVFQKDISSVLKNIANKCTTEEWINKYTDLLNQYEDQVTPQIIEDYIKISKTRKDWYYTRNKSLYEFLEEYGMVADSSSSIFVSSFLIVLCLIRNIFNF